MYMTKEQIKNSNEKFYTDIHHEDTGYQFVTVLSVFKDCSDELVLRVEHSSDDRINDDLVFMGFKKNKECDWIWEK